MEKTCKYCGEVIIKAKNSSIKNFESRVFCSMKCSSESQKKINLKKNKRHMFSTRGNTHPIYNSWKSMKHRCYISTNPSYKNYGGRGISVCNQWRGSFFNFKNWSFKNGWREGLTLDRIDNNGDYSPANCRWISRVEQLKNRRNSLYLTYKGDTKSIKEWAKHIGISYNGMRKRLKWDDIEKIIETPVNKNLQRNNTRKDVY